jgi:hypothetical protein
MNIFETVNRAADAAAHRQAAHFARIQQERHNELVAMAEQADMIMDGRKWRQRQNPDPQKYLSVGQAARKIGVSHNAMLLICDSAARGGSKNHPDAWCNKLRVVMHDATYWIEKFQSLFNQGEQHRDHPGNHNLSAFSKGVCEQ